MRTTVGLLRLRAVPACVTLTAQQEVVAAIQVHGNTLTSSDDIIRASGISVGDSVSGIAAV